MAASSPGLGCWWCGWWGRESRLSGPVPTKNSSDFFPRQERKKRREAGKARDRFNFRNHVQCKLICWVHFRTACSFYFKPIWQGNCWRTVTNLKAFPSVQSPPRCVLISQQVVRSHPRETNVQSYCNPLLDDGATTETILLMGRLSRDILIWSHMSWPDSQLPARHSAPTVCQSTVAMANTTGRSQRSS